MGNANRINLKKEEAIERLEKFKHQLCFGDFDEKFNLSNPRHGREVLEDSIKRIAHYIEFLKSSSEKEKVAIFRTISNIKRKRKNTSYFILPNAHLIWDEFKLVCKNHNRT